jgi:spore photoproduct lyase
MTSTNEIQYSIKSKQNFQSEFSHIYIEKDALNWNLTDKILSSFSKSTQIYIDDYKHIFNRPNQNIFSQQNSKKLILAVKKPPFVYSGSSILQETQFHNIYYTTPLINCIYHCNYCFLQGIYPSANLVAFVNESEFFSEVKTKINNRKVLDEPMGLSIAYHNDLLAFENRIPFCQNWIEFGRHTKNILIEIRTKCANITPIKNIIPHKNILLAWTLTPNEIRRKYEVSTPSFEQRLNAAKWAITKGWNVRICIDPVIPIKGWKSYYAKAIDSLFESLHPDQLTDIVVGVFRMSQDYFTRIRKQLPTSDLFYQNYDHNHRIVHTKLNLKNEINEEIRSLLSNYISLNKVFIWSHDENETV